MDEMTIAVERFVTEEKYKCNRFFEDAKKESTTLWSNQCEASFDGLMCWPRSNASQIVSLPCPPRSIFYYGTAFPLSLENWEESLDLSLPSTITNERRSVATKLCLSNGQWYRNLDNVSWSNYTLCTTADYRYGSAIADLHKIDTLADYGSLNESILLDKWLPIIRTMSQIGYASSFTMLVIAMVVFSMLRKLRNPRNRLHMHLFASFILRALIALLRDWIFVDGVGAAWYVVYVDGKTYIKERNTWLCKAITSFWQYFIVANYSWILMEGLYLHNLVFLALCTDMASIASYTALGWGLPILVVAPWIIIRATMEDTLCWTTNVDPSLFLIIRIPIMISILFNFLLFVNIVRVLFVKLKTSVHLQRKKMHYRQWAKSTLVLVPLFGAHYTLFLGLSYHNDHRVELVWLFCDQLFGSFQGSFVALLYCLLNSEVQTEMKRAWKAQRSSRMDVDSLNRRITNQAVAVL
ncbi:secretin receptor-like [Prorops nasuta]|uniref:secretin receptor-like n=1 Tax=Prorops nasuta TaxID=863751 RepID=UPI0034CFE963